MKKYLLFILIIFLNITIVNANLNEATYDGNQKNYCETLSKSDATKYDFYKCAYFEKIREQNKIHIPTEAELYQKRLKEYEEREGIRNQKIIDDENRKIELEWQINMSKNIAEYQKITKANELLDKGIMLAKQSLCANTEECINAIYLYKESLSLNYRDDANDNLDALYLMLAGQYNKQNQYNNAIKYALLSKNIELVNETLAISYDGLSVDFYKKGDYKKAIEYGILSINKSKDNWYSYYVMGLSSFELKEYKNALFYFDKSLENTENTENITVLKKNIEISNNKILELNKLEEGLFNSVVNTKCGIKSIEDNDGNCVCEKGYVWESSDDLDNLDCKEIYKSLTIEEPKNNQQCENKNGVNSYFDNRGYCLCKEGFEFSKSSGYTVCEEKQLLILRKQINKKILFKLDKILPSILLKSDNELIQLRDKINILLKKKLNKELKNILLYINLSIDDKFTESIDFDNLLN